tara:strand:+ start:47 stop:823 length:777 start_codon:yes stop_codon:yes gene_type:complete
MADDKQQQPSANKQSQFPSEIIDLPTKGKLYPENHPLRGGKIEVKYMTAKEEDILTSQNLIKKGIVIDRLLDSLIVTPGVTTDDLFLGDKNAIMVAARILAYGPEYSVELINPEDGEKVSHTFNLSELEYKEVPSEINNNEFEFELPVSKTKVTFKLLTGKDERIIEEELKSLAKIGVGTSREITTRLKYVITSVDGNKEQSGITEFVQNMLSRDSLALRTKVSESTPDIILKQEVDMGGETTEVDIPMTVEFFWPST